MVDDESKPERRPTKHMQPPAKWDNPFNPAYSYWAYYVYANLYVLNKVCYGRLSITVSSLNHCYLIRFVPPSRFIIFWKFLHLSTIPLKS